MLWLKCKSSHLKTSLKKHDDNEFAKRTVTIIIYSFVFLIQLFHYSTSALVFLQ